MRPCRHCNAALENSEDICPECNRAQPRGPSAAPAPPPQPLAPEDRDDHPEWDQFRAMGLVLIPLSGVVICLGLAAGEIGFLWGVGFAVVVLGVLAFVFGGW